jgi:phosphate transport system protein
LGDHAVNIAQSALFLIDRPQIKPYVDLPKMYDVVISMFKDSITSLVNEDAKLALEVCKRDDQADNLKFEITKELIALMTLDPSTIERAVNILRITTNLERVADLSTNICEDVMYLAEGRVIKHHFEEKE